MPCRSRRSRAQEGPSRQQNPHLRLRRRTEDPSPPEPGSSLRSRRTRRATPSPVPALSTEPMPGPHRLRSQPPTAPARLHRQLRDQHSYPPCPHLDQVFRIPFAHRGSAFSAFRRSFSAPSSEITPGSWLAPASALRTRSAPSQRHRSRASRRPDPEQSSAPPPPRPPDPPDAMTSAPTPYANVDLQDQSRVSQADVTPGLRLTNSIGVSRSPAGPSPRRASPQPDGRSSRYFADRSGPRRSPTSCPGSPR